MAGGSQSRACASRWTVEQARSWLQAPGAGLNRQLDELDVVISPSAPQTAFPATEPAPPNQADLTAIANFAGCPAISLPLSSSDALPAGLQLMARPGADGPLLDLAQRIETTLREDGLAP